LQKAVEEKEKDLDQKKQEVAEQKQELDNAEEEAAQVVDDTAQSIANDMNATTPSTVEQVDANSTATVDESPPLPKASEVEAEEAEIEAMPEGPEKRKAEQQLETAKLVREAVVVSKMEAGPEKDAKTAELTARAKAMDQSQFKEQEQEVKQEEEALSQEKQEVEEMPDGPEKEDLQKAVEEKEKDLDQKKQDMKNSLEHKQAAAVMHKVGQAEMEQAKAKIDLAIAIKTDGDVKTAKQDYDEASREAVAAKLEQLPAEDVARVEVVVDSMIRGEDAVELPPASRKAMDPSFALPNPPPSGDTSINDVVQVSKKLDEQEIQAKEQLRKAKAAFDSTLAHAQESNAKLIEAPKIKPYKF